MSFLNYLKESLSPNITTEYIVDIIKKYIDSEESLDKDAHPLSIKKIPIGTQDKDKVVAVYTDLKNLHLTGEQAINTLVSLLHKYHLTGSDAIVIELARVIDKDILEKLMIANSDDAPAFLRPRHKR